jgi:hypothetical protein
MQINYEKLHNSPATAKQRGETALSTLAGIIEGIECDKSINGKELQYLNHWMFENQRIAERSPIKEVYQYINNATMDGILTRDEKDEIFHGINNIISNGYYDLITARIQELHGIVAGISSDGIINLEEAIHLKNWINDHNELKSHWPYDEIESLMYEVLKDGKIDQDEHRKLLSFFTQFVALSDKKRLDTAGIHGIVSMNPDIQFDDKRFSITGASYKATRRKMIEAIESKKGNFINNVCQQTDYLIYCDAGNKCWTYSCYGRKIEEALMLRQNGHTIQIIAEIDFWDCLGGI